MAAIRRLPPLPILVDYTSETWRAKTQIRMISALAYPDRVCGIAVSMDYGQSKHRSKLLEAMNQPFPALESLELRYPYPLEVHSPPPFLTAQTPHLRSFRFIGRITELYRILPYTTSLVDLTMNILPATFLPPGTQILAHLQGLSFLRHLNVEACGVESPDHPGGEDVLLPTLTTLSFTGIMELLEALMAGLTAPSLQELRIFVYGIRATVPPTHLTSFIRNSGRQFLSAQLCAPRHGIQLVMPAHSHSTDGLPFRIIARKMYSTLLMGYLFSETLATVEDVFLASPLYLRPESLALPVQDTPYGHALFTPFRNAKILRLSSGIGVEVGEMFRDDTFFSDLLPALEEIELNAITPSCRPIRIDEKEVVSVLELFKPFVDARQQAGHPVNVHWNTDRVLPEYFYNTDM